MPIPDRDINSTAAEHLSDHETYIKPVVDAFEGTTPDDFRAAGDFQTAAQTPFGPGGTIASTDLQFAVHEVAADAAAALTAHTADPTDAHDASAISVTTVGTVTQNNVQDALGGLGSRVAVVEVALPTTSANFGTIKVSDFAGATLDLKLTAALADAFSRTYRPTILMPYSYTAPMSFATKGRDTFNGMALCCGVPGDTRAFEAVTANNKPTEITLTFDSDTDNVGWFNPTSTANARGCSFQNFLIKDTSISTGNRPAFLTNTTGAVWWLLRVTNFSSEGLWGVLGTYSNPLFVDACMFDGWWNINNAAGTSINLQGSDCKFVPGMCLIDSHTEWAPTVGHPHVRLNSFTKNVLQNFYITCQGNWSGLESAGSTLGLGNDIYGSTIEGKNAGADYCTQSIINVSGGTLTFHGGQINYCVPDSGEGVCEVTGGILDLNGTQYARQAGVAETVPFARATGSAELYARGVKRGLYSGGSDPSWTGRPRIQDSSSGLVYCDASCTLI